MKYEELEQSAKDYALQQHAEAHDYEWWDFTYEYFVNVARCMGFEVTMNQRRTRGLNNEGRVIEEPDITFSGFCSQGDGAAFGATFALREGLEASTRIREFCQNAELLRIADEIYEACVAANGVSHVLAYGTGLRVGIGYDQRGHCMKIVTESAEFLDDVEEDSLLEVIRTCEAFDEAVLDAARDLAYWLYNTLECEYEYLISEAELIERDEDFDEEGEIITCPTIDNEELLAA